MTSEQKQTIHCRRAAGLAYSQIADEVGLSLHTIKSYYRRAGLSASSAFQNEQNKENENQCPNCGKNLRHLSKTKPKKFCCDKCRRGWWNRHRDQMRHRNTCRVTCAHCGTDFESYSWAARKYCSHACYILARFGQSGTEEVLR